MTKRPGLPTIPDVDDYPHPVPDRPLWLDVLILLGMAVATFAVAFVAGSNGTY